MGLVDGFPAASGTVDSTELRKDLAGLIYRDNAGNARSGVFARNLTALVTALAGTWTVSTAAFEGCSVRGGGPIFMANDGATASPANTSQAPGANSRKDVLYFKQNESAAPYSEANNSPIFAWAYGTPSSTPAKPSLAAIPGAVELAEVLIPSTATSMSSAGVVITQTYAFAALTGAPIWVRNAAELALMTNLRQGDLVFQIDNGVTWKWFDLYNATTNPTGRAAAGWKPWNTSTPVDYYAAGNLVNYTVGPDVPIMTWSAREGRIICEGKLAIVSGSSFSGAFSIKTPSTIPVAAKYTTTSRQDIVGRALYIASSSFPIDVVLQGSTASDRVTLVLENQTGTYPAFASQVTASVPVANVIGYVMTWAFEYDPA